MITYKTANILSTLSTNLQFFACFGNNSESLHSCKIDFLEKLVVKDGNCILSYIYGLDSQNYNNKEHLESLLFMSNC